MLKSPLEGYRKEVQMKKRSMMWVGVLAMVLGYASHAVMAEMPAAQSAVAVQDQAVKDAKTGKHHKHKKPKKHQEAKH